MELNSASHIDWKKLKVLQQNLSKKVLLEDSFTKEWTLVGGLDVSYSRHKGPSKACAAAVIFDRTSWTVVDESVAYMDVDIPYVPGFLSFREIPVILEVVEGLTLLPDIWLVDGAGIAHPRRIGLASHLGVLLDVPTIGVAKSRLVGRHNDLPKEKGSFVPLVDEATEEVIGTVLRSRTGVKPLYISPGHKVSVRSAVEIVLACCTKYRLPEPTRAAHNKVTEAKKSFSEKP